MLGFGVLEAWGVVKCEAGCVAASELVDSFRQGESFLLLHAHRQANVTQVVESVMVINPGSLSKRKAAGTYAQMALHPRAVTEDDHETKNIPHNVFERARVDVVRI